MTHSQPIDQASAVDRGLGGVCNVQAGQRLQSHPGLLHVEHKAVMPWKQSREPQQYRDMMEP